MARGVGAHVSLAVPTRVSGCAGKGPAEQMGAVRDEGEQEDSRAAARRVEYVARSPLLDEASGHKSSNSRAEIGHGKKACAPLPLPPVGVFGTSFRSHSEYPACSKSLPAQE